MSLASILIAGIKSTSDSRLKLVYGAMPPEAITLMYAAAKGISRSKPDALSLALDVGINRNPTTMKRGIGTRTSNGKKWVNTTSTIPTAETGREIRAAKNIIEI